MSNPNHQLHVEAARGEKIAREIEGTSSEHNASKRFAEEVSELKKHDHGRLSTADSNSLIFAAQDLQRKGVLPDLTLSENVINKAAGLPKLQPHEQETPAV